jgi:PAS domain S-box-containing protein
MALPRDESVGEPVPVLLVDDRPENLLALEAVLDGPGLRLHRAGSGEQALRLLESADFAAVVLDVQMAGLDGFETARRIRARDRDRPTPILFVTAYDSDEFPLAEAYALGAVDYLVKPLVPEILRAKVGVFAELYRSADRIRRLEREAADRRIAADRARRERAAHAVALILAEAPDAPDAVGRVLGTVGEQFGWDAGGLWLIEADRQAIRLADWWTAAGVAVPRFEAASRATLFRPGIGVPGRVCASGEPAWVPILAGDPNFPRAPAAAADGLTSGAAAPVRAGGELVGVIEYYSRASRPREPDVLSELAGAGAAVGHFLRRRRTEAALRHTEHQIRLSEERYRTFIRQSSEGIWRFEADRPVPIDQPPDDLLDDIYRSAYLAECNDAMARMYGYETAEELVGARLGDLMPRSDPRSLASFKAFIEGGFRLTDAESHELDRHGRPRVFLNNLVGLVEDGHLVRAWGTQRDVTVMKAAEDALRESEQRFARFMAHLPGLAWVKDTAGRYVFVNDAAQRAFGVPRAALYGRTDAEVFPPNTASQFREHDQRAAGDPAGVQVVESLRHSDGTVRYSLVSKFPIPGPDGSPAGVAGMAIDITDRMRAEDALKEADRRKDEFLAMLAHELRNPLAAIRNASQLLRVVAVGEPRLRQAGDLIDRQVGHLGRLVEDLLDVARIARGKLSLKPERLDLGRLVAHAVADHQPAFDDKQVTLRGHAPDTPVWVMGDATRLAQLLDNLLTNALKFTPAGGDVAVSAAHGPAGRATLVVRDTGAGLDPALRSRLFQPFSQADRTLDRSQGGLGLGLTIVKGLAELHGGTVHADSAGPGQGATFTVTLPAEAEPPALTGRPVAPGRTGRGMRVLIVEDNRDAADSLRFLLEALGHQATVAYTGPDGVRAAEADRPEVIVCDIGLPGLDGYRVAETLRANPATAGACLIALTGYGRDEDQERARQAGFDHHVTKPADPMALVRLFADVA